jgi:hypothetical protein
MSKKKKEVVTEKNFEKLILKSANEALEYTRQKRSLKKSVKSNRKKASK